jgi:glycosyltransferase involved in cell wall biosynthesis
MAGQDVGILLAVYNGMPFLPAQLASFAAQTHGDWVVLASVDSGGDGSDAVLADFAQTHPLRSVKGPGRGFAANFLSLLRRAPETTYTALSDQDDVWYPERLARGITALSAVSETVPALYSARTEIVDADLRSLGPSPRFGTAPDFRNALVQSIGGGNTMMLNAAGRRLVALAAAEAGPIVAHDWWLYQIIAGCGGVVIRDEAPVLKYRQHGGNLIGANMSLTQRFARVFAVMGGRFAAWNRVNMAALARSEHRFTPEARTVLAQYRAAQHLGLPARLAALRKSGVYRQGRAGTLALYLACAMGRI